MAAAAATSCDSKGRRPRPEVCYNEAITPGPREVGFDEAWIMPATGDRVPCVWVETDRVVGLDPQDPIRLDYRVQRGDEKSFVRGIPRIGGQTGGTAALWNDEEMSLVIARKTCEFIQKSAQRPFFVFMATHAIHVPRVPNPRFKGQSDCGVRGDAIVEFDWMVGQVLDQLETSGVAENTLVIITSDKLLIKEKVFFATAKATILPRSFPLLNNVSKVLREHPDVVNNVWAKGSVQNRIGSVEELVGATVYLASDAASFTTGEVITIDGGLTLR